MDANIILDPVLSDVERFLRATHMTATAFGQRALNDPRLVHELRCGRECKMATRARITHFIQQYAAEVNAAASREMA